MVTGSAGYRPGMTENQPRHDPEIHHDEVPDGAEPTTNQPLNAEPRPRLAPALVTILLLAVVVAIILVLTLL